ncbi:MAG TPA: hypothetical protein VKR31_10015 [Rhizomicrobium sp.]|nr:hypothetical protein [Rhizomicrobium sp.]
MACKQILGYVTTSVILVPSVASSMTSARVPVPSFWWVPIVAAFIGAASALVTPFVKDLFIQIWNEKRARAVQQREIFRNYAAPLSMSSEKLIWRFNEIFVAKRHQFLKTATLPFVYNQYKRKSTLYRIACLLGWLRAMNLELSALPRGPSRFLTPISDAIGKVQSALADGPHVEVDRLDRLCAVWHLGGQIIETEQRKQLGTRLEVKLYELGGDELKHDSEHLNKSSSERKLNICRELSYFLCDELHRARLDDGVISETVNQAISAMSYREALIYRDWQDAIGDAMLELDPDSVRRYRIVGYEKFESILEGSSLWMEVFRGSIDDIDLDSINPNDFRAKQLRDLAASVAQILICFSQTDERDLISEDALAVARKLTT